MKSLLKKLAVLLVALVFVLLAVGIAGELALRAYYFFKYTRHGNSYFAVALDEELGWRPWLNYSFAGTRTDAIGRPYPASVHFRADGFRLYGDPATKKTRILVLGDSMTQAMEVSDDKTYYGLLTNRLPVEIFAYGTSGYGTLQEFMILDRYVDVIRPQMVLWQCSGNDFINNDAELERRSYSNNNRMRRPYLEADGSIRHELPSRFAALRDFAARHSRFLYFLFTRWDRRMAGMDPGVEAEIAAQRDAHPGFQRAARTTAEIFRRAAARLPPGTRVVAFDADQSEPYYSTLRAMVEENGWTFVENVGQALLDADAAGEITRWKDRTHWNERGHQIVADRLTEALASQLPATAGGPRR